MWKPNRFELVGYLGVLSFFVVAGYLSYFKATQGRYPWERDILGEMLRIDSNLKNFYPFIQVGMTRQDVIAHCGPQALGGPSETKTNLLLPSEDYKSIYEVMIYKRPGQTMRVFLNRAGIVVAKDLE